MTKGGLDEQAKENKPPIALSSDVGRAVSGGFTVAEIAEEFGLSRQSIYNSINRLLIDRVVLEHKIALAHRQHGPDIEEEGQ